MERKVLNRDGIKKLVQKRSSSVTLAKINESRSLIILEKNNGMKLRVHLFRRVINFLRTVKNLL